MGATREVVKMTRDVETVLQHARCVVCVDEEGLPYCTVKRGSHVRKRGYATHLNIIAVVGPHRETGKSCVWVEIGMNRAVPYARSEIHTASRGIKKVMARTRFYHPTEVEMEKLWSFLLSEMCTHMCAVSSEWLGGCVWKPRLVHEFLSRKKVAFSKYTVTHLPKGVRFRVSFDDAWLVRAVVGSDWVKNRSTHAGRHNFLALCLADEPGRQSKEGWALVQKEDRIILAKEIVSDLPAYTLAGSLIPSALHAQIVRGRAGAKPKMVVPYESRVKAILSLLETVNAEKCEDVLRWMAVCTRKDMMPEVPHLYIRPESSGRQGTLSFELAPISREEIKHGNRV
jgi:hypothetical protein